MLLLAKQTVCKQQHPLSAAGICISDFQVASCSQEGATNGTNHWLNRSSQQQIHKRKGPPPGADEQGLTSDGHTYKNDTRSGCCVCTKHPLCNCATKAGTPKKASNTSHNSRFELLVMGTHLNSTAKSHSHQPTLRM
jgi:hypothetical protein